MKYVSSLLGVGLFVLALQILPHEARPRTGASSFTSLAGAVKGEARVIDGDTLEVADQRIRLEGIDAPEIRQRCERPEGKWPAGKIAASTLQRWISDSEVVCHPTGRDGYDRIIARCTANNVDLNARLIREGLAWAFRKYSQTYIGEEQLARIAKKGIWASTCQTAWDYRAIRWHGAEAAAPAGCAIKGNVTRNGRIYHMPWSPWYRRTRIELRKGERWFCNERQALEAGWRPAFVR